jgi:hypothetical protein
MREEHDVEGFGKGAHVAQVIGPLERRKDGALRMAAYWHQTSIA